MGARAFSEAERINALGDCLADALDHAGLYEVGTDADFALLVDAVSYTHLTLPTKRIV